MKSNVIHAIFFIVISLFLHGCATSRSVIDVPLPKSENLAASKGAEIYINSVTDNRVFEANPADPNIPSLDPSEDQGATIQSRALGRKRNSFGKGLGDILLPETHTIESIIQSVMRQTFIENGYKVLDNKQQITPDTVIVDAQVNKFWSWMNPGFWAITLSTEISTNIDIKKPGLTEQKTVSVKQSDTFQTGVEGNWLDVIQSALKAYAVELNAKLKM